MDFINTTFAYHKEALELRYSHQLDQLSRKRKATCIEKIITRRMASVIKKNEHLKCMDIEDTAYLTQLENKLEAATAKLKQYNEKIEEMFRLNLVQVYCGIRNEPIPPNVKLQCEREISAANEILNEDYMTEESIIPPATNA